MQLLGFGIAFWLGLYLISRDPRSLYLRLVGLSALGYSLWLGFDTLSSYAPTPTLRADMARVSGMFMLFAPVCWTGALLYSLPEKTGYRRRLFGIWDTGFIALEVAGYILAVNNGLLPGSLVPQDRWLPPYLVLALLVVLPLTGAIGVFGWARRGEPQPLLKLQLASSLFLLAGTALTFYPPDWLPAGGTFTLSGAAMLGLGLSVAARDAQEDGEVLLPHLLRSFDYSFFMALVFGGQVGLVVVLGTGLNFPMLALLLSVVATSIAAQIFIVPLQNALDQVAFAQFPRLLQARADLRAAAEALPRLNDVIDLDQLSKDEFVRLTRRALSHYGDLTRLAANPLTQLPIVRQAVAQRGAAGNSLESAVELKAQLAESISRLRPPGEAQFGTSAEWRHYNVLYYPYVVGLRLYSRRAQSETPELSQRGVLAWFATNVPERTLYNWQNNAAHLVAQDLYDRSYQPGVP